MSKTMYLPLIAGGETEERMSLLLSLARFNEATNHALTNIYVNGWTIELAAYTFDQRENNLNRSIKRLDEINKTVHTLNTII